jgi:hypothetical protein
MYISTTPFRKTRNGIESRLFGCLGEYIIFRPLLLGQGPVVLYDGIFNIWRKPL